MLRFFLLPLIMVPYWLWLSAPPGAPHLSHGNPLPYIYALLSLAGFLGLGWWLFSFDADDRLRSLGRLGLGSVTSLIGLYVGSIVRGHLPNTGPGLQFVEILRWIPGVPLWVSIVAYTVQVGMVEESIKAVTARTDVLDGVRVRAGFGFVAGVGFGVAEGLLYSFRDYAGTADWHAYMVRFVTLVGLHACLSTIAVLCLPEDWWDPRRIWFTLLGLLPMAFLHGTYDALLTHNLNSWAGAVATVVCLLVPVVIWFLEARDAEP